MKERNITTKLPLLKYLNKECIIWFEVSYLKTFKYEGRVVNVNDFLLTIKDKKEGEIGLNISKIIKINEVRE